MQSATPSIPSIPNVSPTASGGRPIQLSGDRRGRKHPPVFSLAIAALTLASLIGCRTSGIGGAGLPGTSPVGSPTGSPLPSTQLPNGELSPPSLDWPSDGSRDGSRDGSEQGSGEAGQPSQLPEDMLPESGASGGVPLPSGGAPSTQTSSGDGGVSGAPGDGEAPLDPSKVDWTATYEGLERGGGQSGSGGGALTPAERVAAAERALEESVTRYDGVLLEESASAPQAPADATSNTGMGSSGASRASASNESSSSSQSGGGAQSAGSGAGSAPDAGEVEDGTDSSGDASPAARPGENRDAVQDDDVVARQLREAAEAETDPELREKLWEEYRRYKEGL